MQICGHRTEGQNIYNALSKCTFLFTSLLDKYLVKNLNNSWRRIIFFAWLLLCIALFFFLIFPSTVSYFIFSLLFFLVPFVMFSFIAWCIDQAFDRGMVLSNMKMKDPAVTWTILFLRMLIHKWVTLYSRMHLGPCLMRIKNNKIKSHRQWIDLNPLWEHNLGVYSLFFKFFFFFDFFFAQFSLPQFSSYSVSKKNAL